MSDDPTPRQIAKEIAIYVLAVLFVGAAFVAVRVAREGTRVLTNAPHAPRDQDR